MRFLDILVFFRLVLGQISFKLVENAFATRQLALFVIFFRLSLFSFSFLFAPVTDFLLGLLAVKKLLRKRHRDGQFLPWSSQV